MQIPSSSYALPYFSGSTFLKDTEVSTIDTHTVIEHIIYLPLFKINLQRWVMVVVQEEEGEGA
jgi:hypothetical protein